MRFGPLHSWLGFWILPGLLLLPGCFHYQPAALDAGARAAALEARSLSDPGLKEFALSASGNRGPEWPPREWDFDSLTLAAFYFHPSLEVARSAWRAARAGEVAAGARPNPTISIGPQYAQNAARGVTPWLAFADLDLPLETAGKRGHRLAQAAQLSQAARLGIISSAWEVRGRVRGALLSFMGTQERGALLRRQAALQESILGRMEQKLAAGAASSAGLVPFRTALQRARLELGDAERSSAEARAAVAAAVGIPLAALADVSLPRALPELSTNAFELTSAQGRRLALTGRADLRAALAEYEAAEAALRLEVARQYPDLRLGPGYEYDQGENKFGVRLGLELPVLSRNRGPIAQAAAKREQAGARFAEAQARVLAEIEAAGAAWRALEQQGQGLDALMATQRQHVEMVRRQVDAGAAEPLELLLAEAEVVAAELARLELRVKRRQAWGRLEDAIQQPLPVDVTRDVRPERAKIAVE